MSFFLSVEKDPYDKLQFQFNPTEVKDPHKISLTTGTSFGKDKEKKSYAQIESVERRKISVNLFMSSELTCNHKLRGMTVYEQIRWLQRKLYGSTRGPGEQSDKAIVLLVGIPLVLPYGGAAKLTRAVLTRVEPTYVKWDQDWWPVQAMVEIDLEEWTEPPV